MRLIDRNSLEGINSPIKLIMEHIPYAMINVAPERAGEFQEEYPNLLIKFSNDNYPNATVNNSSNEITFSRGLAELCWSSAYSYPILYEYVVENSKLESSLFIDLTESGNKRSIDLLNWALKNSFANQSSEWPDNLPQPYTLPDDVDKKLPECQRPG